MSAHWDCNVSRRRMCDSSTSRMYIIRWILSAAQLMHKVGSTKTVVATIALNIGTIRANTVFFYINLLSLLKSHSHHEAARM